MGTDIFTASRIVGGSDRTSEASTYMASEGYPILGIDPGIHGAIALLWQNGNAVVYDIPNVKREIGGSIRNRVDTETFSDLIGALKIFSPECAFVEQIHGRPGMSVSGIGVLSHTAGIIEGVLTAQGIPIHLIPAHLWKSALGLSKDKNQSRNMASRIYPCLSTSFSHVKDDGRAEAVLLAHYGLMQRAKSLKVNDTAS